MALGYALQSGFNVITVKQAIAAAETITLDGKKINGGQDYSIVGGLLTVMNGDGAGGTIDIKIDGTSILGSPQSTNTPIAGGLLILSSFEGNLSGKGGDDITITTTQAAACQVNLFLAGTLEDVV